ncbi:related to Histidinol-phosphate aminotransferase [Hanseniaspora guilliermondii]|uniref:histidinol-phosphate transaminase n=1 Tax=Hanseniaspora guilliermondii TaxID=56406 RepID=A0A1L0B714_9ASCO|nr:related to Histidinol-phosphate aminotransferase [Hanseniaspora guilliermondii]
MSNFKLADFIRPKIYNLEPYRCARDDFKEGILLDANENTHGPSLSLDSSFTDLNRYPDPHQRELKTLIANYRNSQKPADKPDLTYENLCLGVGSDESIDAIMRASCVPGKNKVLICPPTYGMYSITADINDLECVKVPLLPKREKDEKKFQLNVSEILSVLKDDKDIRLVMITSPGNPTAAQIDTEDIRVILNEWKNGFVVVDEAYIDFGKDSVCSYVNEYPNLVVFQTLSKAFGLAGVRMGISYTSRELSTILNAMKAPYSVSTMASELAINAFSQRSLEIFEKNKQSIIEGRQYLIDQLTKLPYVDNEMIGGLDANFILIRIIPEELAQKVYYKMATESKVVVRYRGNELNCKGGLRVSIGTQEENEQMVKEFKKNMEALLSSQ